MAQLTYYVAPWDRETEPAPEDALHAERHVGPSDEGGDLPHGFALADIHRAARLAVSISSKYRGMDIRDKYDEAWHAIVEALYTSTENLTARELVWIGSNGINSAVYGHQRMRGIDQKDSTAGQSMPFFWRYWWLTSQNVPSPEARLVERIALRQIWPHLTLTHRQVLTALAVHGTHQAAAEALGKSITTYQSHLSHARKAFLRLWHEHEEPSQVWGADQRVWRGGRPLVKSIADRPVAYRLRARSGRTKAEVPHGVSRYRNHGCRCLECTDAVRVYNAAQRAKKGATKRRILTAEEKAQIIAQRAAGLSVAAVAAGLDISVAAVYAVQRNYRQVDA
jgi:hypothetical protein